MDVERDGTNSESTTGRTRVGAREGPEGRRGQGEAEGHSEVVVRRAEGEDVVGAVDEDVLAGHEVRVGLDARLGVEPGEHRLQELRLLRGAACGAELFHVRQQKLNGRQGETGK